jgi:hypothetical protein
MNMPLFPIHRDDGDVGQLGDAVPYGYERAIHVAVGPAFHLRRDRFGGFWLAARAGARSLDGEKHSPRSTEEPATSG